MMGDVMPSLSRRALLASPVLLAAPAVRAEEDVVRGPTRPHRLAALGPQGEGVVREVMVAEGDTVRANEVLLRLDDAVQEARIGLARAAAEAEGEWRQAMVQRQEAEAVLARTLQAAGRGAATEWEVRQARARLDATSATAEAAAERRRVEQRRLDLELAQQQVLVIRAPFDGVVTRLDAVPGATLTRADRPVTVADLSVLEAVLYVPASAWRRLSLGGVYTLHLSEPVDGSVRARLRHMDPVMDAASGRFRAVFTIENPGRTLPAGLEAALDLALVGP
jgi:RND family efflux transporter MFP subunit